MGVKYHLRFIAIYFITFWIVCVFWENQADASAAKFQKTDQVLTKMEFFSGP